MSRRREKFRSRKNSFSFSKTDVLSTGRILVFVGASSFAESSSAFKPQAFEKHWNLWGCAGARGSVVSGWMRVPTSNPLNWFFLSNSVSKIFIYRACAQRAHPHGPITEYCRAFEADLKLNFLHFDFQTGYFSFFTKIISYFICCCRQFTFSSVMAKLSQIEKFPTEEVDEVESDIIMISTKRSLILFNRLIRQKHQQHLKQYQRHNYSNNIHHRTLIFRCAG